MFTPVAHDRAPLSDMTDVEPRCTYILTAWPWKCPTEDKSMAFHMGAKQCSGLTMIYEWNNRGDVDGDRSHNLEDVTSAGMVGGDASNPNWENSWPRH